MNKRFLAILFSLLFITPVHSLFCLEPIQKTLTQQKFDKFITDLNAITSNTKIKTSWDSCFQQATFDELMNPNSALLVDDTLNAVFTMLINTRVKIKQDKETTSELKKYNWNEEFWDVYVIAMISSHYKTVTEENAELDKINNISDDKQRDKKGLPDLTKYINQSDYALFLANYNKIQEKIDQEIIKNNGF